MKSLRREKMISIVSPSEVSRSFLFLPSFHSNGMSLIFCEIIFQNVPNIQKFQLWYKKEDVIIWKNYSEFELPTLKISDHSRIFFIFDNDVIKDRYHYQISGWSLEQYLFNVLYVIVPYKPPWFRSKYLLLFVRIEFTSKSTANKAPTHIHTVCNGVFSTLWHLCNYSLWIKMSSYTPTIGLDFTRSYFLYYNLDY